MAYTPILTNLNKAKNLKSLFEKSYEIPIVFPFPDEDEFFEFIAGWASHHDMEMTEASDHYQGYVGFWRAIVGKALLASWKDGKAYLHIFGVSTYKKLVTGEFKEYTTFVSSLKPMGFLSLLDLFGVKL